MLYSYTCMVTASVKGLKHFIFEVSMISDFESITGTGQTDGMKHFITTIQVYLAHTDQSGWPLDGAGTRYRGCGYA